MNGKTAVNGLACSPAFRSFLPWHGTVFAVFFFASLLFGFPFILLRDGGTCRHIDIGLYILNNHVFPQTNFAWALDPNHPWLTYEIGNYIAFGLAYKLFALNGVVLLTAVPLTLALMWALQMGRVRGLGPLSVWFVFIPAFLATSLEWSARPLVFSYIGFLAFFYLTVMSTASLTKRTILAGVIGCLWINMHGSALLGVTVLLIRPLQVLIDCLFKKTTNFKQFFLELLPPLAAAVGISFNLLGPAYYPYLYSYLTHPRVVLQASEYRGAEWGPFDITITPGSWAFLFLLVLVALVFCLAKYWPPLAQGLYLIVLALAGFYAMRFVPYFALIALPILGPAWRKLLDQSKSSDFIPDKQEATPGVHWFLKSWKILLRAFLRVELFIEDKESKCVSYRFIALTFAFVAMLIGLFLFSPAARVNDFSDTAMPVASVTYLGEHASDKLGFVVDNWAPYLYFRLHHPIFIDDKVDFYPEAFVEEYKLVLAGKPGWQGILDKYNLAYLLIPKTGHLAEAVKVSPDWQLVFSDKVSSVYFRKRQAP
ncbi:MAG: hypothetical protein C5B53_09860 [Candidatus Melainabacteria bacterium]|nr:MAG: hypothetical protein C5B53_09860 [Candidatus Melainabacteria bacterium]